MTLALLLLSMVFPAQEPSDLCASIDCGDLVGCVRSGEIRVTCTLPAPPPLPDKLGILTVRCYDAKAAAYYDCGTLDLTRMDIPVGTPSLEATLSESDLTIEPAEGGVPRSFAKNPLSGSEP